MREEREKENVFGWLTPRKVAALIFLCLIFYIIYYLKATLLPVFIALFFAYAFNPVIDRLEKLKLGRTPAVVLLMTVMAIIIFLFLLYLIPAVAQEVNTLKKRLPEYFENLRLFLALTLAPWLKERVGIEIPTTLLEVETFIQSQIENIVSQIGGTLEMGLKSAFIGTMGMLKILISIIIVPFFFFFFLRDFPKIEAKVKELIPLRYYGGVERFALKANRTLAQFFRGQLTVAFILAILYSAGLSIIGIDLAIFLGVLSGVLFLIPYLGLAIAGSLSILVSLLNFSGGGQILWILVLYATLPLVEMFFLTPKIVGSRLTLSPATVVLALFCFGGLFGVIGVIIALPATALIKLLAEEFIEYYHKSDYYNAKERTDAKPASDGGEANE